MFVATAGSAARVKEPQVFAGEKPNVTISAAELKLTKTLFAAFHQDEIDLMQYKDQYTERVAESINTKVSGREVVTSVASKQPDVINLMDALKKSLAQAKPGAEKKTSAMTEKAPTRSAHPKATAKRNSKTA